MPTSPSPRPPRPSRKRPVTPRLGPGSFRRYRHLRARAARGGQRHLRQDPAWPSDLARWRRRLGRASSVWDGSHRGRGARRTREGSRDDEGAGASRAQSLVSLCARSTAASASSQSPPAWGAGVYLTAWPVVVRVFHAKWRVDWGRVFALGRVSRGSGRIRRFAGRGSSGAYSNGRGGPSGGE